MSPAQNIPNDPLIVITNIGSQSQSQQVLRKTSILLLMLRMVIKHELLYSTD